MIELNICLMKMLTFKMDQLQVLVVIEHHVQTRKHVRYEGNASQSVDPNLHKSFLNMVEPPRTRVIDFVNYLFEFFL